MIGAIIGDIVGSRFEWHNIKTKEFDFFGKRCRFTDDTVMTLAVCDALMACDNYDELSSYAIKSMQELGNAYPRAGYGKRFKAWLKSKTPEPYNSWGNGAAMRVGGCGYVGESIEEVMNLAQTVTAVTHDHPEGIKAAKAVAVAVFLARTGKSMDEIYTYINDTYYSIDFTLDAIRDTYKFDVSCQGSVPQAFAAFFESKNFEDAIRNAISIGGDSDTIAAITGSIAEAYYGVPDAIRQQAGTFLDERLTRILTAFEIKYTAHKK